jgi:hypothetical protein
MELDKVSNTAGMKTIGTDKCLFATLKTTSSS